LVAGLPRGAFKKSAEKIKSNIIPQHHQVNHERQIFVRSNFKQSSDGGNLLAFSERHEAQPSGEAFVAGSQPVQVTLTKAAVESLNACDIVEVPENEVQAFTAAKLSKMRGDIERQKQIYRQKYIDLVGSSSGFENAWESIRAKLSLSAVVEGI
jgi:hypothetical protein